MKVKNLIQKLQELKARDFGIVNADDSDIDVMELEVDMYNDMCDIPVDYVKIVNDN